MFESKAIGKTKSPEFLGFKFTYARIKQEKQEEEGSMQEILDWVVENGF